MNTERSDSQDRDQSNPNDRPDDSAEVEKQIETPSSSTPDGFRPNWLETGPLSPLFTADGTTGESPDKATDESVATADDEVFAGDEGRKDTSGEIDSASAIEEPFAAGDYLSFLPPLLEGEGDSGANSFLADETPDREIVSDTQPDNFIGPVPTDPDPVPPAPQYTAKSEHDELLTALEAALAAAKPPEETVHDYVPVGKSQKLEPVEVLIPGSSAIPPAAASISVPKPQVRPVNKKRQIRRESGRRKDRLSIALFSISTVMLAAAALIYFVNPFTRLALGTASLARPVNSPGVELPRTGSGEWCLRGDFLDPNRSAPRLLDSGTGGDIRTDDQVYSLEYLIPQAGTYEWQVIDCSNPSLAYPPAPAWIRTAAPGQVVTFIFESDERSDPLFFPISYVVSAVDSTTDYRVVGSFQDWNPGDDSSRLEAINSGLYQQVRRIARAGEYEAFVIADTQGQAVDAYGRTTEPIPFSFETNRNGDFVVFLVDTDRGRASVLYDMPPLITSLAFGDGYRILSFVLGGVALALLAAMLLRLLVLRNEGLQMEMGCPRCGEQELMRISRTSRDRLLHVIGIPAYRYRCRQCTWEGTRLSEEGATISPGAKLAPTSFNT